MKRSFLILVLMLAAGVLFAQNPLNVTRLGNEDAQASELNLTNAGTARNELTRVAPELVFDINALQAGPMSGHWMFDLDGSPFNYNADWSSIYAYAGFSWNEDGHGDGTCDSGGSGVVTTESGVSENVPFAASADELGIFIDGYALTFFEHINTENPEQPWDTMGEAGDHREYTGGIGEISHNGEVVLYVEDVLFEVTTYYPEPIGNGGPNGFGTVVGVGNIDMVNSDPDWVAYFDRDGSGELNFYCGSMSPVIQACWGTYNVDDLVIYGSGDIPEIGWGNLQWPLQTITLTDVPTENIYGQVWVDGFTSEPGATVGLTAQLGYGAVGSDPTIGWTWTDAAYNAEAGNNDEYVAQLTVAEAGDYDYTYRYAYGGDNWYYAQERGALTVNAVQVFAEVNFVVDMSWQEIAGNFDPLSDFVDIGGNFSDWNSTGALNDLGDGLYGYTIELEVGYVCEYKYRLNGSWDTAELPGQGNRSFEVIEGGQTVNEVYDNWIPEIGFAELIDPFALTINAGEESPEIYGQLNIPGLTDGDNIAPLVEAQVGYGTGEMETWDWFDAEFHQNVNDLDEYAGTLTVWTPGEYNHSYRFRFNEGEWHYSASLGFMTVEGEDFTGLMINEIKATIAEWSGEDIDHEYIEIYNSLQEAVNLEGVTIDGAVSYTFEAGTVIDPDGVIVVASNPDTISTVFGIDNVVGPFVGSLPDIIGTITLLSGPGGDVIDQVDYDTDWHWEAELGWASLELMQPELDNNLAESWCTFMGSEYDLELYLPLGGTPGLPNVHYCSIYDVQDHLDAWSELEDQMVNVRGIVTARFFGNYEQRYVIQVPEFIDELYKYSGVLVYANEWEDFELGDLVEVSAIVTENGYGYGDTVLDPWNIELISNGNPVPDPVEVEISDFNLYNEDYEGVYITTCGICSNGNENGYNWNLRQGLRSVSVAGTDDEHASAPPNAIAYGTYYTVRGINVDGYIWMVSDDGWNEGLFTDPGTITGTVTSLETGLPIEGAAITAVMYDDLDSFETTTDEDGFYSFDMPIGFYKVYCSAVGYVDPDYDPTMVDQGEIEVVDFALEVNNLPPVVNFPDMFSFDMGDELAFDINDYAIDPEGNPFTFWVEGNVNIQVEIIDNICTLSAVDGWEGTEDITFVFHDEVGDTTIYEVVTIEVNGVNVAPWIDLPANLTININEDTIPYIFDFSEFCGDANNDYLWAEAVSDPEIEAVITDLTVSITPVDGFTGSAELTITVSDVEFSTSDVMNVNISNQAVMTELVFDITALQSGPVTFGANWMFDAGPAPFSHSGTSISNYAYLGFDWNVEGIGDGGCGSGGSGVVTEEVCVSENLPFVDSVDELSIIIDGFDLTLFEHINTENPGDPWNTWGEAGDHRQYSGGIGNIYQNGELVLAITDVLYDVTTYYPAPIGNGGGTGYGTVDGEGFIDVANSDPQWVAQIDPAGEGKVYYTCNSMSPVLQDCYGTYNVDDLVIFGSEPLNHAPVFYLPQQFAFDEDTSLTENMMDYAIDVDGDALTVTVGETENIIIDIDGTNITFSAAENWFGTETVVVTVNDNQSRATATDDVEIVVNPVNDAPWIDLPEEITIDSSVDLIPYIYDVTAFVGDVEGDDLMLMAVSSMDLSVTIDGLVLTIDVPGMQSTIGTITLTVYDEAFLNASDVMTVNVIAEPSTSIHGWITDEENFNAIEGVEVTLTEVPARRMSREELMNRLSYTVYTDIDGYYEIALDPGMYDISAIHPDYEPMNSSNIIVEENLMNHYSFTMMPVNTGGYITNGLYTMGCLYGDGFVNFSFADLENLASGCSQDAVGYGDFTDMTVTVYPGETVDVSMQAGFSDNDARIWVDFNNDFAFDIDEMILDQTVLYQNVPVNAQVLIPDYVVPGEYRLRARTVWNNDDFDASSQYDYGEVEDYTLIVSGDVPPELGIELPVSYTMDEDYPEDFDLTPYITGVNYTITYEGSENISISLDGMTATFTPALNFNGSESVTFTVSDDASRTTLSDDMLVEVMPVNDDPVINLPMEIEISTVSNNLPYGMAIDQYIYDIEDEDELLVTSFSNDPNLGLTANGFNMLFDPPQSYNGWFSLTVTVMDTEGATAFDNINIHVTTDPATAIYGWMTDFENDIPLEGVNVQVFDTISRDPIYEILTDEFGYYYLPVAADIYNISIFKDEYLGYWIYEIEVAENEVLEISRGLGSLYNQYPSSNMFVYGCDDGDYIDSFELESISNTSSGCSSDDIGYGLFSELSTDIGTASDYVMSVTAGHDDCYLKAWIDFNDNYHLSDTPEFERIVGPFHLAEAGVNYEIPFSIPEAAYQYGVEGTHVMRVRIVRGVDDFIATDMQEYGEIEDYTVNFIFPSLEIDLPDEGIAFDEDTTTTIDLADYVTGLGYDVSWTGNDNMLISILGTELTFTPYQDWNGAETITITVDDGMNTDSDDILVTVNPVNDAPVIDMPTQLSFYTYGPKVRDISAYYSDVDGDELSIMISDTDEIGGEVIGSNIHLLVEDGWTGTDTWTITVSDGVTRTTASDVVNIQVGDALIINFDDVFAQEEYGTGCFDFSEDGAELSVIPPAGEGWECNGSNDPSWGYYPGELSLFPGRLYVDLSYFDLHWFQVDVTLFENCGVGCTELSGTMGQDVYMTNYNTESFVETHITIVNGMGLDLDGFYISTLESTIQEIHVYFADQDPTYIGGHITDMDTDLPLNGVALIVTDVNDPGIVYSTGTGPDGNYYVEVEPSTYDLEFNCPGYESVYYYDVTLAEGDFVDYSFAMIPQSSEVTLTRELVTGWNWISLNLECEDMSLNGIFNSFAGNGASIKGLSSFAMYYPGLGWSGSMTSYDLTALHKLQMTADDTWEITGTPVDVYAYPIDLTTGWNWISYLPQEANEINYALSSLYMGPTLIKGASQFASYYPGAGWMGSLTELTPLHGYMLNMDEPGMLMYPEEYYRTEAPAEVHEKEVTKWQINPADFEFNAIVVASVEDIENDDYLIAKVNDEIRGIGEVLDYTETFGTKSFALMVYSNSPEAEDYTFTYYDSSEDTEYLLNEKLMISADDVIGGFDEPVILTIPAMGDNEDMITVTGIKGCVPNPFNPSGTIFYNLEEEGNVQIDVYNIKGQKVKTLINESMPAGNHQITWNGNADNGASTASGMYFVRMQTNSYEGMDKIILLK